VTTDSVIDHVQKARDLLAGVGTSVEALTKELDCAREEYHRILVRLKVAKRLQTAYEDLLKAVEDPAGDDHEHRVKVDNDALGIEVKKDDPAPPAGNGRRTCKNEILWLLEKRPRTYRTLVNDLPHRSAQTISSALYHMMKRRVLRKKGNRRTGTYSIR
jgi:hypothetical protein